MTVATLADRLDALYGPVAPWPEVERLTGHSRVSIRRHVDAELAVVLPGSTFAERQTYLQTHYVRLNLGVRLAVARAAGKYVARALPPEGMPL